MKLKSTIFIFFFLYLLNIIFCQEYSSSNDNSNEEINNNSNSNNNSNNENSNNNSNDNSDSDEYNEIDECIKDGNINKEKVKCCKVSFKINDIPFGYNTPIYDKLSSIKEYKKMLHDAKDVTIDCSEFFLSFYKIMIFLLVFLF